MNTDSAEPIYYPVVLNIAGRRCAVIGGGQVALRKVNMLLEAGAKVTVISPNLCPDLIQMAVRGEIHTTDREYRTGDLEKVFVAIAATDNSEINEQVVTEAREGSVLVNVVDDAENSDFIVPSYFRRGSLSIAVSTSGESPALARKIRSILEKEISADYSTLVDIISEVRTELKRQNIIVDSNGWQEALDIEHMFDFLRIGENEKAKFLLLDNLITKQRQTGTQE
ncbi:bifunctional precorrin-2 dehydrogenase/sirohydrochlorin ferrochelatase [Chloroflexota bacterium]